jgi:alkyl sulfatase BDS1-like metallo-beta-lactamase superfamily hydrolase
VFAQPDNQTARELQAGAYEQMATRPRGRSGAASTSPRRVNYDRACGPPRSRPRARTILAMPADILLDFAAVHVIGEKAAKADLRIDFTFTDLDQTTIPPAARGELHQPEGLKTGPHPSSSPSWRDRVTAWLREEAPSLR